MYNCTTVRLYDRTTVRPYDGTIVEVLLLTCVVNCTAGMPTLQLCPVDQWSVHWAPSQMTWVLVLEGQGVVPLRRMEKKMWVPLLGFAKSTITGIHVGTYHGHWTQIKRKEIRYGNSVYIQHSVAYEMVLSEAWMIHKWNSINSLM